MRLFMKEDYGYHRLDRAQVDSIYPSDSSIGSGLFFDPNTDVSRMQRIYNMEQLGLEAVRLRRVISENRAKDYLSGKAYVEKKNIGKIIGMRKDVVQKPYRQRTLLSYS